VAACKETGEVCENPRTPAPQASDREPIKQPLVPAGRLIRRTLVRLNLR
jgi:hypothetical protein